ncbi:MAG TPA: hypothetical protein DIT25_00175 [Candidatus Moranbacteria bacterium]|nr:hypothetical protein [Candidatus Moranbacteria bacterium]
MKNGGIISLNDRERDPDNMSDKEKVKISTALSGIAVFVIGSFVLAGGLIYGTGADNQLAQKASRIFPYPAAAIDGVNFISIKNLQYNLKAVKRFYENQDFESLGLEVDFDTPDGQKRLKIKEKNLLTKLIENRIIEILANQKGIVLSPESVEREVSERVFQFGEEEELANNLQKLYGWTIKDFEEKIVKPDIYKQRLAEKVKKNDLGRERAEAKIKEAEAELAGKNLFSETAKKYSEGESAKDGGEVGWFSFDQMLPEIAISAAALEKGATSEIIESSLGYHIIKIDDKKTDGGAQKIKISQIFVRTQSFSDWLLEQEKNIKIYVLLKDMRWNREKGLVEFTSEDLKKFEENLEENSPNDPSVLF